MKNVTTVIDSICPYTGTSEGIPCLDQALGMSDVPMADLIVLTCRSGETKLFCYLRASLYQRPHGVAVVVCEPATRTLRHFTLYDQGGERGTLL